MIQILDSGPATADRYTLIDSDGLCWSFDSNPFHPLGFGQFVGELGRGVCLEWVEEQQPINLGELPEKAQDFVRQCLS